MMTKGKSEYNFFMLKVMSTDPEDEHKGNDFKVNIYILLSIEHCSKPMIITAL